MASVAKDLLLEADPAAFEGIDILNRLLGLQEAFDWLIDWLIGWFIGWLTVKIVIHVPVSGFGCWPLMNYLWIIVWCLSVFSLRSALQVPCLTCFFFDSSVRWLHFKENFIVKSYFPNWQERGSLFALEGWPRSSSGVVDARMQWLTPWTWLHFVI